MLENVLSIAKRVFLIEFWFYLYLGRGTNKLMAQTEFAIWLTRQLADHNPPWKVADLARAMASQEVDAVVGTEYWKSRVKSIQNNISNIMQPCWLRWAQCFGGNRQW